MKKILYTLIIALSATLGLNAQVSDGESINYRVMYKWGLVNKQAGRVNLSTQRTDAQTIKAQLTARTEKWADAFYSVRDTLAGFQKMYLDLPLPWIS